MPGWSKIHILLIGIVLITTGCGSSVAGQSTGIATAPTDTAPPSITATATATPLFGPFPTPTSWLRYNDAMGRFSFDYPVGWIIGPNVSDTFSLAPDAGQVGSNDNASPDIIIGLGTTQLSTQIAQFCATVATTKVAGLPAQEIAAGTVAVNRPYYVWHFANGAIGFEFTVNIAPGIGPIDRYSSIYMHILVSFTITPSLANAPPCHPAG